jgi:hypothetical protein
LIQPYDRNEFNPKFFKAYPEQIENYGVTEKQLSKLT